MLPLDHEAKGKWPKNTLSSSCGSTELVYCLGTLGCIRFKPCLENNLNLYMLLGLPHGPFWIYSSYDETFIFVHFERGKIVNDDVTLVMEKDVHFGLKGKLVNSTFLQNIVKVRIAAIGEYNCLQIIKTMELLEEVNVGILDNMLG